MTTAVDEFLLSAAEVEIQATGKSPTVSIVAAGTRSAADA